MVGVLFLVVVDIISGGRDEPEWLSPLDAGELDLNERLQDSSVLVDLVEEAGTLCAICFANDLDRSED